MRGLLACRACHRSSTNIDIARDELGDRRERLAGTRWPDALDGVGWTYGVPPEAVREPAAYRLDGSDRRAHEARLNKLPQYTTEIDGQRVHFVHMRSVSPPGPR
ncbi:epoxide hydrolase N-terminal domain-containing protein [Nonomuraea sp. NPDC049309]|uniref:epoxide hydrolase N-terminal domain-containing protein n=1 Tax=Nonomuraea sp. NPDC049309 TaxID=3364350 RepID=UPI0037145267